MIFAFDTETFPIRPGRQAPRIVCVQSREGGIELREPGLDRLERALHEGALIVGHNVAYDALCSIASRPRLLVPWFRAYESDRVACTLEREKLGRIAEGTSDRHRYDLISCLEQHHVPHDHREGDKDSPDAWRTRYHELDGIPVDSWPPEARRYALADLAVEPLYYAQSERFAGWLDDEYRQARAAFALALTSAHGMRVSAESVDLLSSRIADEHEILRRLLSSGDQDAMTAFCDRWSAEHFPLEPVPYSGGALRPKGTRDTKAVAARMHEVCSASCLPVPLTPAGAVALDADATAATLDPVLLAYSRFTSTTTILGRCDRLRLAAAHKLPIQPRFDTLKKTGRTSCRSGVTKPGIACTSFGDQTQNLSRAPGLRECYEAREGCVILSVDWVAAELGTLAQTCIDLDLGSRLAEVLTSGQDVHLWFGAIMKGWTYAYAAESLAGQHGPAAKKEAKTVRQGAKACNFGFPGGLGIEKFRAFAAKTFGIRLTDSEAHVLKAKWLDALPEMPHYFAHIAHLIDSGAELRHFRSNRYRGDLRYTAAANSYFQGRCADMLKDALFRCARACYVGGLPARIWNQAHDEILFEVPRHELGRVSREVVSIMESVSRDWCPAAPPRAEPAASRIWRKGAEPYYDDAGDLAPWEDRPLNIQIKASEGARYASWLYGITAERARALGAGA